MKAIISTAVIGMISAGVYGIIDISNDVKNGTMIRYEQEAEHVRESPKIKESGIASVLRQARMKAEELEATKQKEAEALAAQKKRTKKEEVDWSDVKMEYFSRSAMKKEHIAKRKKEEELAVAQNMESVTDSASVEAATLEGQAPGTHEKKE